MKLDDFLNAHSNLVEAGNLQNIKSDDFYQKNYLIIKILTNIGGLGRHVFDIHRA